MPKKHLDVSGVLLVDKPVDWTSHDVVKFIRGFGIKKVGHAGTLDPAATGLLVLLLGKGTKLSNHLTADDKVYRATITLGEERNTYDREGEITETLPYDHVTDEQIMSCLQSFTGEQDQIPPMFSAKKIEGKTLYELARKGVEVEREPVRITIHDITAESIDIPEIALTVHSSKGTYIRSLAHDIGRHLGTCAYLSALERTRSGFFQLDDAVTMDDIKSWNPEELTSRVIDIDDIHARLAAEAAGEEV